MKSLAVLAGLSIVLLGMLNASPIAQQSFDRPIVSKMYSAALVEKLRERENNCEAEMHVSDSVRAKLRRGDYINIDQNGKCYIKCFLESVGIFEHYDFSLTKLASVFGSRALGVLQTKCGSYLDLDKPCEAAYIFFVCYMRAKQLLDQYQSEEFST